MKRFTEQLNKKATAVKLRAAEKRELRERVVSYMEYHPLSSEQKAAKTRIGKQVIADRQFNEAFATFKLPFFHIFKYGAVVTAMVLLVIPAVAERAVPGDTLYAVKVRFNEEVKSTLTFDTYEKVEWETERLNRRIAEARLLASEGKLTEEVEAGVADAVRIHTANAQREIEVLRSEDADAATIASISFNATLEVQSSSLKNEGEQSLASTDPSGNVNSVSLIASAIDASRVSNEDTYASSTLPAYDKLMAKVELNTTRIYELLEALKLSASPEDLADAVRRSDDINRSVEEAVAKANSDDGMARQQLVDVMQRTQRLIVFLTELEVIETVNIENIIPVVLTEEEKSAKRQQLTVDLDKKVARIDFILANASDLDEGIVEKVQPSREEIVTKLASLTPEVAFDSFLPTIQGLHELADDMLILLDRDNDYESAPILEENSTTSEEVILDGEVSSTSPTSTPDSSIDNV